MKGRSGLKGLEWCTVVLLTIASIAQAQPTYRLLVVYTPAAAQWCGRGVVKNWVRSNMINQVNTIYTNSANPGSPPISKVELAGIDSVTYTETNPSVDAGALRGYDTGPFSRVPELRDRYAADVVFLVGYAGWDYAGISLNMPVTQAEAFSAVGSQYVQIYYTSAHEAGHMVGCGHDLWTDGYGAFVYGHGWGYPPVSDYSRRTWNTVMTYGIVNGETSSNRIPYFSNPNVAYQGNPTGVANSADNARVIRENVARIDAFRTTPATVAISDDTYFLQEYGDVMATNSITTGANLRVKGELRLRATQSVTINSGFTVENGAVVTISAGSGALGKRSIDDVPRPAPNPEVVSTPSVNSLSVRASRTSLTVNYALKEAAPVTLKLYEMQGRLVVEKNLGTEAAGWHSQILRPGLRPGRQYYVMVMRAGRMSIQQAVMMAR